MVIPPQDGGPFSDSRRDALRYQDLLLALEAASKSLKPIEQDDLSGPAEMLERLLPYLAEALRAEQSFLASLTGCKKPGDPGPKMARVIAAYPQTNLAGKELPCTPLLNEIYHKRAAKVLVTSPEPYLDLELFGARSAILVPLQAGNQMFMLGVCNRTKGDDDPFLASDRRGLESVLELVALGLNLGEKRHSELQQLQHIIAGINAEKSLDVLLPMITQGASQVFQAPSSLMLWDQAREKLEIVAAEDISQAYIQSQVISKARFLQELARLGDEKTLYIPDLRQRRFGHPELIEKEGLRACLSTLLQAGNEKIGILNIYSRKPNQVFGKGHRELAEILAGQAAIAIANAHLRQDVLDVWQSNAETLKVSNNLKGLARYIVHKTVMLFNIPAAGIAVWENKSDEPVQLLDAWGLSDHYQKTWSTTKADLLAVFDGDDVPPNLLYRLPVSDEDRFNESIDSILVVKLEPSPFLNGVLLLYAREKPLDFSNNQLDLMRIYRRQIETSIQVAVTNQDIEAARSELEDILQTVSSVARAKSANDGLLILARYMVESLSVTLCHIATFNEIEQAFLVEAAYPPQGSSSLNWDPGVFKEIPYDPTHPLMSQLFDLTAPTVFERRRGPEDTQVVEYIQQVTGIEQDLQATLVIVLRLENRVFGVCILGEIRDPEKRPECAFDEGKVRKANSLAGQAIAMIDRTLLHELTQRRAQTEERLRKAGIRLTQMATSTIAEVTNQIACSACEVLGADCSVVYPYYTTLGSYDTRSVGSCNLQKPLNVRTKSRLESTGIANYVLFQNPLLVVNDIDQGYDTSGSFEVYRKQDKFLDREKIQSFIGVRLEVGNTPVGAMFINFRHRHTFTRAEQDIVQILASQASISLDQARLFERGKKEHLAIQAMRKVVEQIGQRSSPRPIWRSVIKDLMRITGARHGLLIFHESGRGMPRVEVELGNPTPQTQEMAYLLFNLALRNNRSLISLNTGDDPEFMEQRKNQTSIRSALAAPFNPRPKQQASSHPEGAIVLLSPEIAAFTPDDLEITEKMAVYAGSAVRSSGHFAEVRQNARLLEGFLEANQEIINLAQEGKVLQTLVDSVKTTLGGDIVILYPYDPAKNELEKPFVAGRVSARVGEMRTVSKDSVVKILLGRTTPYFADTAPDDPLMAKGNFVKEAGVISSAGVPLYFGDEKLGVLFINYLKPHTFSKQERKSIALFGIQASIALHNADLYHVLGQKNLHLGKAHEAGKLITTSLGLDHQSILALVLKQAVDSMTGLAGRPATIGDIQLEKDGQLVFECIYPDNNSQHLLPLGKALPVHPEPGYSEKRGITMRAFLSGQPQLVNDVSKDPDYLEFHPKTASELAVPLLKNGQPIGVLNVESDRPWNFNQADVEALQLLADFAVIALSNAETAVALSQANTVAVMGAWGADVVHDVAREVGNIRLSLQILEDEAQNPQVVQEKADEINRSLDELQFPEIPEGKLDVAAAVHLGELAPADEIISIEAQKIQKKFPRVQILFSLSCGGQKAAIHNLWFSRILRHLLTNAARIAYQNRKDGALVQVRSILWENRIQVQVEDNGPGVPKEFEPFLFKKPIQHPNHKGRGLLLVDFLVRKFGGEIQLAHNDPGGACFTLSLPCIPNNPAEE